MSENELTFLSYEEAVRLVGAIQEEEDIHRQNHRILTVYSVDDRELCWFDYQEVMDAVGDVPDGERKESVQKYILNRIPEWARQEQRSGT
ncbi:MAG: hypothetical protein CR981_03040 [Proteobacteria bacterium]|nr:MAG: hypothetical protein CR981_03040 [Pseudomonadota bacterium]PIE65094.1 MAG: hypothetical protein CSA26_05385 [Desulfobacterales bacterium]